MVFCSEREGRVKSLHLKYRKVTRIWQNLTIRKMSRADLNAIQTKLKTAIQSHQVMSKLVNFSHPRIQLPAIHLFIPNWNFHSSYSNFVYILIHCYCFDVSLQVNMLTIGTNSFNLKYNIYQYQPTITQNLYRSFPLWRQVRLRFRERDLLRILVSSSTNYARLLVLPLRI